MKITWLCISNRSCVFLAKAVPEAAPLDINRARGQQTWQVRDNLLTAQITQLVRQLTINPDSVASNPASGTDGIQILD